MRTCAYAVDLTVLMGGHDSNSYYNGIYLNIPIV